MAEISEKPSNQKITVKAIERRDLKTICDFEARAFKRLSPADQEYPITHDLQWYKEFYDKGNLTFGAFSGKTLIGKSNLVLNFNLEAEGLTEQSQHYKTIIDSKSCVMSGTILDKKSYKGKKIQDFLLNARMAEVRQRGYNLSLSIINTPNVSSWGTLLKHGFQITDVITDTRDHKECFLLCADPQRSKRNPKKAFYLPADNTKEIRKILEGEPSQAANGYSKPGQRYVGTSSIRGQERGTTPQIGFTEAAP